MEIGAAEAATWLGVSIRRVQALAASGRLAARRVGGHWLIDVEHLARPQARSRPMSPSVGAALIALLTDPTLGSAALKLAPSHAHRLRLKLAQLRQDSDPASLLSSWLAVSNPVPVLLSAQQRDLPALLGDPRVVASGISDPRANLAVADAVEGWVLEDDLDDLIDDYLLTTSGAPNVRLRLSPTPPPNPTPLGQLLADLCVHPGAREGEAVKRLLSARHR